MLRVLPALGILRAPAWVASSLLALALGCSPADTGEEILATLPLDSLDEVLTKSGVTLDTGVSSDGRGSIAIEASGPVTVRIAEIEGFAIENARLIYRARLRSSGLQGRAFLEMWCAFPGKGEYFSRALQSPLVGTNDWVTQETPFFLEEGQRPDRVKLNLVIDGRGTVWIDEVVLAKAPL